MGGKAEIWSYRSSGNKMFAVISGDVSKSIINTIENRQTMGEVETDKNIKASFQSKKELIKFLEDNNFNYTFTTQRIN